MQIGREELLRSLDAVSPGLSKSELVEQSNCYVFEEGRVQTYNDEVACTIKSPLKITGAVDAEPLKNLLSKLKEEFINMEQENGELLVKGKGRRAGIRCQHEIRLPIGNVEKAGDWQKLPEDFTEAIEIVSGSAGKNDSEFVLTCIHLTPKWVEASDDYQITRYKIKTGLKANILVRANSLKSVIGLDMTEFSESQSWIHFRNPAGLIYSCRRYVEAYPDLTPLLKVEGTKTILPPGLMEAVDKAQVFSSEDIQVNQVTIQLQAERLLLEGRGVNGWYQEMKKITYDGEPMKFVISPRLLEEILKRTNECLITDRRLVIDGGKFVHVGCIG